jgi:long-chain acyl-CoA synthetase
MKTDNVQTLNGLFLNTCRRYVKPCLLSEKIEGSFAPISTAEFENRVRRLSLGFRSLGLKPGDKVVLLSENRPDWVITDFAVLCAGAVTVPLYTSLTPEQIKYLINDSEARIIVCSNRNLWLKVEAVRHELPLIEHAVMIDEEPPAGLRTLSEVMGLGTPAAESDPSAFEKVAAAVRPGDLASIIYTSGTTGKPKGVMLSHGNFISNIESLDAVVPFREPDLILSFLPLSHVLERTATFLSLYNGASIAYAESVESVAENLVEVRPTIMISVPRLFEKIYQKVMDQILAGSQLKRAVFFWALKVGKEYAARTIARERLPKPLAFRRSLARKLVFSKILAKVGGRVKFFVCGGAPISSDIVEFFYAMGLVILPGYGLTETSPVISGNTLDDYRFGTVGKPIPGVEVRIAEDGEILARGGSVMMGYYKNEAETAETMAGGWLHTADIGYLDPDGFLVITDRKKDILVTSGGKNVAPQPIENLLQMNPYVQSAVVLGDRRKFISALIVPNFEKLEAYARAHGVPFADRAELCRREEIVSFLLAEIQRATPHLASYERIKKIALLDRDFDIGSGEVTPTLKIKRNIVGERYREMIDTLYKD